MTVIAGIEVTGGVHMIADSCESEEDGYLSTLLPHDKIIQYDGWAMGLAGYSRPMQLYRYALDVAEPPPIEGRAVERWLVTEVVAALFQIGRDFDLLLPVEPSKPAIPSLTVTGLVAVRGGLWYLSDCGAVTRTADGYGAAGSGRLACLAAMDACPDMPPDKRLRRGVEVAAAREPGVAPPFCPLWVPA